MSGLSSDPVSRLIAAQARLKAACEEAGRTGELVEIIAATKGVTPERIVPLLAHGRRRFGENRVQEASAKWPGLREAFGGVELHLIGPLQSNKAREAVSLFDVIETIDRPKIASAIAEEIARQSRAPKLLVQVNLGEEPQKSGVPPREADGFIRQCQEEFGLMISGVMGVPPASEPPAPYFSLLHAIAARSRLPIISMGMSADYDLAAQLGATHVRLGTALFGERPD